MAFAYLGNTPLGSAALTGPTASGGGIKSTYARHAVATGKPVLQDMQGDELGTKKLRFFLDETFCDPDGELGRLERARAARKPLAFVPGDGSYTGERYVVESIDQDIRRTTVSGRTTRLDVSVTLIESPVPDLLAFARAFALAQAPASVQTLAGAALSIAAKVR